MEVPEVIDTPQDAETFGGVVLRQTELDAISRHNLAFIASFAELLPPADIDYVAGSKLSHIRAVGAHVLWSYEVNWHPRYIVGEALVSEHTHRSKRPPLIDVLLYNHQAEATPDHYSGFTIERLWQRPFQAARTTMRKNMTQSLGVSLLEGVINERDEVVIERDNSALVHHPTPIYDAADRNRPSRHFHRKRSKARKSGVSCRAFLYGAEQKANVTNLPTKDLIRFNVIDHLIKMAMDFSIDDEFDKYYQAFLDDSPAVGATSYGS